MSTGVDGRGRDGAGPRLVALDLDGTLLDWSGTLLGGIAEAVAELRDRGDHVVVATGRSVHSALPYAQQLGMQAGPAVTSNGAVTVELHPEEPGYRIADLVTFDAGPALRLVREELPDALFAVEDVGRGFFVHGAFPDGEMDGHVTPVGFDDLCAVPATRVVIRSPEHTDADFHAMVERIGLHEVSYAVGWTAWLDLSPQGVSKATALEAVREQLGVDPSRTVAVGDGRNDVEMLRWAARGVAMGHADDVTRAAADEVTGSWEDGGALAVLHDLLTT
ncbi:HAD family hydrolase [Actinotalea sp. Marseille-Q4924]|uniref:HAD family hydrolase n=1 Tax=Actinotalea sp. Marseille-Q4924 TaxID=2866571 RepID=UPI001CE4692E|nr:HAD family hydrolase [Actinotalea sp. Marseille-Q4924]